MTSMVLSSKTPVYKWEYWFIFEVYCSKYAAARVLGPSSLECNSSKRGGLSAFSTNLTISHGFFNSNQTYLTKFGRRDISLLDDKWQQFIIFWFRSLL